MDEYLEQIEQLSSLRQLALLKSVKKPKFRINRVPEELRLIPVCLDIEYEQYILRDQFQWNLNDQHISPLEFVEKLVQRLGFGNVKKMHQQLLFQIMEYVEKHSYHNPQEMPLPPPKRAVTSEKKKQALQRQARIQSTAKLTRLSFGLSKKCNNCEHTNIQGVLYCKKCKLPFTVVDNINCNEPITKACLLFYEIASRKQNGAVETRRLSKEDFGSLYTLKAKLAEQVEDTEFLDDLLQNFMKFRDNLEAIEQLYTKPRQGRPRKAQISKPKMEEGDEDEQDQDQEQEQEQEQEPEGEQAEAQEDEDQEEEAEEDQEQDQEEDSSAEMKKEESEQEEESSESEIKQKRSNRLRSRVVVKELRRSIRKRK